MPAKLSSLWTTTAAEPEITRTAPRTEVDLAIVGGGFTGLSAALHAAGTGLRCQVLEAQQIGHGGSGRNVGLVNPGVWLPPKAVETAMGARASLFLQAFGEAPAEVFRLIEQHQIRCEPRRDGTLHAAHAPRGLDDLRQRHAQWQALGAPVQLLEADAARHAIGSAGFHGALLDARAGTINPMGYARGLARAALGAGATISTGTPVTALKQDGRHWRLAGRWGEVRARQVILATNAYTDQLWPALRDQFTAIDFFQMATAPVADSSILPGGQGLWDTAPIMTSLRRDAAGRLIIGAIGSVLPGLSQRWAARRLMRLFPSLGPVRFETAWHGRIAMTPDHLPRIHRLAPGLYTPIGYNGRGITTGTILGRALARLLSGGSEADLPLPLTDPRSDRLRHLRAPFYRAGFAAHQLVTSF